MAIPKSICDNCANTECLWRAPTGGNDPPVMSCPDKIDKSKTNYGRIISKTPKELAVFMTAIMWREEKSPEFLIGSINTCLDWLKQEAEQ